MERIIQIDTHVAIWLYSGLQERFSPKASELLNNRSIFISPIVELEIQYLFEVEKIKVNSNTVISVLEKDFGLKFVNVDFKAAMNRAKAFSWTRDPFDRIISATADLKGENLLTKDKVIRSHFKLAVWDK
jgi:PIN domain nuclease of toxin-antitoxin system